MTDPKKGAKEKKVEFASKQELEDVKSSLDSILDIVKQLAEKPAVPQTPEEVKVQKEITEAGPDDMPHVTPAWDKKAREIIGDAIDRCEVYYPKNGGTQFTVIIKKEFSNAPLEYMQMNKEDRRTREIGNEGIQGVEQWCKLIAQNLKRPRPYAQS